MNKVTLIGNLTADPEIRTLPAGGKVASLRMATNEYWTDKASGERRSRADFHRLVVFTDGLIDAVIAPYARRGKQVAIEGAIRTRKWTDAGGQDRWTTEVVIGPRGSFQLLGSAPGRTPGGTGGAAAEAAAEDEDAGYPDQGEPAPAGGSRGPGPAGTLGDDVPF